MSNLKNISDYKQLDDQENQRQPDDEFLEKIPFLVITNKQDIDPKNESFFHLLHLYICPRLKLLSLTTFIQILIIILFIVSLNRHGIQKQTDPNYEVTFLQVPLKSLIELGCMNQYRLLHGQLYRLITSIFLHWNFLHIFFNSIALLCIMSYLEYSLGFFNTGLVFIISGIGGNIFSAYVTPYNPYMYTSGVSSAVFGLVGCCTSFMILNLEAINRIRKEITILLVISISIWLIFLLSILTSAGTENEEILEGNRQLNTDGIGHFGGFLTGILIGLWLPEPISVSDWTKNSKYVGITLTSVFFFLSFVLFFTVDGQYIKN